MPGLQYLDQPQGGLYAVNRMGSAFSDAIVRLAQMRRLESQQAAQMQLEREKLGLQKGVWESEAGLNKAKQQEITDNAELGRETGDVVERMYGGGPNDMSQHVKDFLQPTLAKLLARSIHKSPQNIVQQGFALGEGAGNPMYRRAVGAGVSPFPVVAPGSSLMDVSQPPSPETGQIPPLYTNPARASSGMTPEDRWNLMLGQEIARSRMANKDPWQVPGDVGEMEEAVRPYAPGPRGLSAGGGGGVGGGLAPQYGYNRQTKQTIVSLDGGRSWKPLGAVEAGTEAPVLQMPSTNAPSQFSPYRPPDEP